MLLALWLYATMEGIGAARAWDRLCEYHAAYRWLCGGVPVNHNLLSVFRRDSGTVLDGLLTRSLTGLIEEGLVTPEKAAIDRQLASSLRSSQPTGPRVKRPGVAPLMTASMKL